MNTEENRQAFRSLATRAFSSESWPVGKQLTFGNTPEELRIQKDFVGFGWWDVPADLLEANYGSLALMTPAAFRYFLPSYILYSLDHFDPNNEVLMFTVFALSPTKTPKDDPNYTTRVEQFSADEKQTIRQFLKLVREAPFYSLWNDAERGLKKFWSE